jgi:hypothetical protein
MKFDWTIELSVEIWLNDRIVGWNLIEIWLNVWMVGWNLIEIWLNVWMVGWSLIEQNTIEP